MTYVFKQSYDRSKQCYSQDYSKEALYDIIKDIYERHGKYLDNNIINPISSPCRLRACILAIESIINEL